MAMIISTGIAAPFGSTLVTFNGIVSLAQERNGANRAVFAPWIRVVLTLLVNLCLFASVSWIVRNRSQLPHPKHRLALSVFGAFSVGYLLLVLPGALIGFAFDRYMLPLFPLLMIAAMMQFASHRRSVPVPAWICLLLFSGYAVANTHDYIAGIRARAAAAHRLESTGIGRDRISAGFEYDGWTQLERSEYVRVVQYDDQFVQNKGKEFWFEFWDHSAGFRPDFVILNWNSSKPASVGELNVDYQAWMPPFRRSVVAWKRSDLTTVLQAARIASVVR
jgi:hypothetical protein